MRCAKNSDEFSWFKFLDYVLFECGDSYTNSHLVIKFAARQKLDSLQ